MKWFIYVYKNILILFNYDSAESERKKLIMNKTIYDHRTGETVMESGSYISQSGKVKDLKAGEPFPVCPDSGRVTTWGQAK
jgi:hypothetical protein